MITIREVAPDHADAHQLWGEQQADLALRYDDPDVVLETRFDTLIASLVAYAEDGEPVASLVLRWSPYDTGAGSVEIKRLWVREAHRGRGHAKVLMGRAEAIARRAGATRIILETGTAQPEALGLYGLLGYHRIVPYGQYKDEPDTVCFALELPTRVLAVTGAMGAGKTAVSSAALSELARRGARVAWIDADILCEAYPATGDDSTNAGLLIDALTALAPVYRSRGYGCLLLPRILEDPSQPGLLAHALASEAGTAEVTVVRVTAPADVRIARLEARETAEWWLDWARVRTVEMDAELDALALEDASVENTGRTPQDAALELLDVAGW